MDGSVFSTRAWIDRSAARGMLSCSPAQAACRSADSPCGSRFSSAPTCRLNVSTWALVSSSRTSFNIGCQRCSQSAGPPNVHRGRATGNGAAALPKASSLAGPQSSGPWARPSLSAAQKSTSALGIPHARAASLRFAAEISDVLGCERTLWRRLTQLHPGAPAAG